MKTFLSILLIFFITSCCSINQQRVGDILDDIKDNVENIKTIENSQQIDYIKKRIQHLEGELNGKTNRR